MNHRQGIDPSGAGTTRADQRKFQKRQRVQGSFRFIERFRFDGILYSAAGGRLDTQRFGEAEY